MFSMTLLDGDCTVLAQVGKPWMAAVVASGRSRAGKCEGVPLELRDFVWSVRRLAWAKANGCPWDESTCHAVARGGHLEVLQWARERHCPWNEATCRAAAAGGHLLVLQWAWENHCPWDAETCEYAAGGGHLEVLQWVQRQGCPCSERICQAPALGGHLEVLRWAREHGCEWDSATCSRVRPRLAAVTWRCCSGRVSATARGMRALLRLPLTAGI